ncbi:autotransporter outer membrane beta-barrel domain-containing protein [Epilithonimonas caeni]|uniref:hypothetical protein n=1 Tax=Epilithonimonas caeni TaxID=365343 RepID=UPI000423FDE6|nr:hypothetical protein [Epilithonimonas caeni]
MIKQIYTGTALIICGAVFAQVGINTDTPSATLDVMGKPTEVSTMDGIIAPRIEGAQLRAKTYTPEQTGALVYVTVADTAPDGQTIDVITTGYYYFNGIKWVSIGSGAGGGGDTNIYNSDGSLTGPGVSRTLTLNGKSLDFVGAERTTSWDSEGRIYQKSNDPSADAVMGFRAGNANLWIQQWHDADAWITATGSTTQLGLTTHYTNDPAPITLSTSPGGNTPGIERIRITGEGNIGVDTPDPTERFDNAGITRLRNLPTNGATNAINTTTDGDISAAQDQTFTATRTVVADANGVLGSVAGLPVNPVNIYNANGFLTSARTLTNSGFALTFLGSNQSTTFSSAGGIRQFGTAGIKRADIVLTANDNNGDAANSTMSIYQDAESAGQIIVGSDSRGLTIGSRFTTQSAPIKFETSAGGGANSIEKMRITGEGNIGVATGTPTEKLDNNGITRLRNLPQNGTANAIYTMPGGAASTNQDQTFTATRTVVADANGVLGYVNALPSDAGTTKVIVNVSVPGTQNLMNAFSPPVTGQFTNESIDTYNAWTNNVFTVPANLTGLYSVVMQNSSSHTSTGTATPTWSTIAFYEKSTDGGTNWSELMRHTYSNLAGTIVDNGNIVYWTGFLNAGDQLRVRLNCNSTTDNIIKNGGITITKIAQ